MHAGEGAARPLFFRSPPTANVAGPSRTLHGVELTILMPCLNEAKTVVQCVDAAFAFLRRAAIQGEVVVADNGSTDGSPELACAAGARVIHVADRGYGAALIGGVREARGSYIIMGDADCSYDFANLDGFVKKLRGGADLVMGNRFAGGIAPGAMPPLHRYLGNPVLSFVGRLFFRTSIRDFHCGLRGFSSDAITRLGLVTHGMEFASEMVAKAALAGLLIEEVPTELRPDGRDRAPHLRTWRDGWRHLRFLLLFCPRWLFLYPGIALFAAGVTGLALLSRGTVRIASVGLDIHSQLYMGGATVIGTQMIALAIITKWMAVLAGIVAPPKWLLVFGRYLSVESGLIASMLLIGLGFAHSVQLVAQWGEGGFGALDPVQVMRQAIPAITLMIIGAQVATTSLFAAALQSAWQSGGKRA
jgi:glycosyltransferase involved in cell wall biosynthesis